MKNLLKPMPLIIIIAVGIVTILVVRVVLNRVNNAEYVIPDITAVDTIGGSEAKALRFGYSWFDGKDGVVVDAVSTWQGDYTEENTLVVDGEMGQNMIPLTVEKPTTANYVIYLPNGAVYDNGEREVFSSLSSYLYWTDIGIGILLPPEPGEYIYELKLCWEKNDLKVTYGIKVVMTGILSTYDEALYDIWKNYKEALSVTLFGIETLPYAEYAGECYVFEVALPDGSVKVAVSKEDGTLLVKNDGV